MRLTAWGAMFLYIMDCSDIGDNLLDFAEARKDFPITLRRSYLNAASLAPMSNRVIGAVNSLLCDLQLNGRNNSPHRNAYAENHLRPNLAALIGAHPSEIAFIKNTTEGLNIVANSLPWKAGDNVVLANIEYPSNAYCWLNLRARGVDVRWVDARQDGRVPVERIADAIDRSTRLVSISAVQFSSGFAQDLERTGELCLGRGILLNYDGIQAVGSTGVDVSRYHLDFLSAGGHKWLAGPMGTGLFYCRASSLHHLTPHAIGPGSMRNEETDIEYDLDYMHRDARRFEEALPNYPGLWGLDAAVTTLRQIGLRHVAEHTLALTRVAADKVQAIGYKVHSSLKDGERSGILCFRHPTLPSEDVSRRLADAGVDVTVRQGNIRISPHFYNNLDDIDALTAALPA